MTADTSQLGPLPACLKSRHLAQLIQHYLCRLGTERKNSTSPHCLSSRPHRRLQVVAFMAGLGSFTRTLLGRSTEGWEMLVKVQAALLILIQGVPQVQRGTG